jgi:hypothetical protein
MVAVRQMQVQALAFVSMTFVPVTEVPWATRLELGWMPGKALHSLVQAMSLSASDESAILESVQMATRLSCQMFCARIFGGRKCERVLLEYGQRKRIDSR